MEIFTALVEVAYRFIPFFIFSDFVDSSLAFLAPLQSFVFMVTVFLTLDDGGEGRGGGDGNDSLTFFLSSGVR